MNKSQIGNRESEHVCHCEGEARGNLGFNNESPDKTCHCEQSEAITSPSLRGAERRGNLSQIITPEIILKNFTPDKLNEEVCAETILRYVHADGAACPYCSEKLEGKHLAKFYKGKKIRCKKCNKFFSGSTGTFFYKRFKNYAEMFYIMLFFNFKLTASEISRITGKSYRTIGVWKNYFKQLEKING